MTVLLNTADDGVVFSLIGAVVTVARAAAALQPTTTLYLVALLRFVLSSLTCDGSLFRFLKVLFLANWRESRT